MISRPYFLVVFPSQWKFRGPFPTAENAYDHYSKAVDNGVAHVVRVDRAVVVKGDAR